MKKLLFILLLGSMLLSCKDNPSSGGDEDVFEPFTIGSFYFNNPSTAEYIGVDKNKVLAKSATTIIITSPDQQQIHLRDLPDSEDRGLFKLSLTDSTITIDTLNKYDDLRFILNSSKPNLSPLTEYGSSLNFNTGVVNVNYKIGKLCNDDGYAQEYDLHLDIRKPNGDTYKKYIFKVSRFSTAIDTLNGC